VRDLLYSLDPNHDGSITFEEFLIVMQHIDQQMMSTSSLTEHNSSRMSGGQQSSKFLNDSDKRMYEAFLPKQGVYFLPDEKLIAFLK
jgi:hypothetical protein